MIAEIAGIAGIAMIGKRRTQGGATKSAIVRRHGPCLPVHPATGHSPKVMRARVATGDRLSETRGGTSGEGVFLMAEFTEKRRFPRYTCDTGVQIRVGESSGGFWGTLSDISRGGCYVYTFSPLPIGQTVGVGIKANGADITVTGKVVSSHPGVGMGISFDGFAQQDSEKNLNSYLTQLACLPKSSAASGVFH